MFSKLIDQGLERRQRRSNQWRVRYAANSMYIYIKKLTFETLAIRLVVSNPLICNQREKTYQIRRKNKHLAQLFFHKIYSSFKLLNSVQ